MNIKNSLSKVSPSSLLLCLAMSASTTPGQLQQTLRSTRQETQP